MNRLAVIKLGSRISIGSNTTSGGTGEALAIIKILIEAGYDVDAYTKILDKDEKPNDFEIFNIEDSYKQLVSMSHIYDALIVINGNVNYFGGQDDPSQTLNYYIINNFKCKVFYILCDCNLLLKQIWPSVSKKQWANNYNQEDIEIKRNDIIYISQPRDVNKLLKLARKHVNVNTCIHFPFEKFPLLTMTSLEYNNNPKYDLLYGGTFRSGHREEDMIKFYFGYEDEYDVTMFGKISDKNFNKKKVGPLSYPEFESAVNYDLFNNKMNESKATVIIGDKLYKELDDLAQRIYESVLAKNVLFIDASYDYNKRVFKNKELRDFCYVNNRFEVIERLDKLKDNNFRKYIVDLQLKDIEETFNIKEYSNELRKIIEVN